MRIASFFRWSISTFVCVWSRGWVRILKSALFSPTDRSTIIPALRMSFAVVPSGNSQFVATANDCMNCSTPSQALEMMLLISSNSGRTASNAPMFTLLYRYSIIGISPSGFGSTLSTLTAVARKSELTWAVISLPVAPPVRWKTLSFVNTSNFAVLSDTTMFTPITGSLPGFSEYTTNAERGSRAYA